MKKLILLAMLSVAAFAYNSYDSTVPYDPTYNTDTYHPSNNPSDWN